MRPLLFAALCLLPAVPAHAAPPKCDCQTCDCTDCLCGVDLPLCRAHLLPPMNLDFRDASRLALKQGKPLILFVNVEEIMVNGCIGCALPWFPGCESPGVLVCVPEGASEFRIAADIYGPASAERILSFLKDRGKLARRRLGLSLDLSLSLRRCRPGKGGCR
jgi:hypothetical protein